MSGTGPAFVTVVMFGGLLAACLLGYPIGFVTGGIALVVGLALWGPQTSAAMYLALTGICSTYIFLAIPLFVFMGMMVQASGIGERLYEATYNVLGGLRGGLAIVTILVGTVMAATCGVMSATVVMLGTIALPSMMQHQYDKSLSTGCICAGGSLGILIPPSIMIVIYGPTAGISVGKLFMAAFVPGFLLSGMYILYIAIRCWLNPQLGPALSPEERRAPAQEKVKLIAFSMLPVLVLILAVLGAILLGIASPTEAAATGSVGSLVLALLYGKLDFKTFKKATLETGRITSMMLIIAIGAQMFTSVFLALGGGHVVTSAILSVGLGKWGPFLVVMLITFILGMFVDWPGIIFIMVPLISPIAVDLGFDPIWFGMMVIVNLQMSFMTPPLAQAIFFLQGVCRPEWRITSSLIIVGVVPYVLIIMLCLLLCVIFPQLILWLPSVMVA